MWPSSFRCILRWPSGSLGLSRPSLVPSLVLSKVLPRPSSFVAGNGDTLVGSTFESSKAIKIKTFALFYIQRLATLEIWLRAREQMSHDELRRIANWRSRREGFESSFNFLLNNRARMIASVAFRLSTMFDSATCLLASPKTPIHSFFFTFF